MSLQPNYKNKLVFATDRHFCRSVSRLEERSKRMGNNEVLINVNFNLRLKWRLQAIKLLGIFAPNKALKQANRLKLAIENDVQKFVKFKIN